MNCILRVTLRICPVLVTHILWKPGIVVWTVLIRKSSHSFLLHSSSCCFISWKLGRDRYPQLPTSCITRVLSNNTSAVSSQRSVYRSVLHACACFFTSCLKTHCQLAQSPRPVGLCCSTLWGQTTGQLWRCGGRKDNPSHSFCLPLMMLTSCQMQCTVLVIVLF